MVNPESSEERIEVVIVGAGRVGATTAYAALITGLADEITLVDRDLERAEGEVMDLMHGLPYLPPARLQAGGTEACREADIIILTAGAARQSGDSRLDLAVRNLELTREILSGIDMAGRAPILIVVSNPVDLLTLAAQHLTGWPAERVLGTGTTLDTARLRSLLAAHFDVDSHHAHAYVVGEHGETEVPVWSLARIGNLTLNEFARATGKPWNLELQNEITRQVRTAGAEVIRRKGATHFAIGLATVDVARAVLRDERAILTVSSVLSGGEDLDDVALSMPCVIGRAGRIAVLPLSLAPSEEEALRASSDTLRSAYREARGPEDRTHSAV